MQGIAEVLLKDMHHVIYIFLFRGLPDSQTFLAELAHLFQSVPVEVQEEIFEFVDVVEDVNFVQDIFHYFLDRCWFFCWYFQQMACQIFLDQAVNSSSCVVDENSFLFIGLNARKVELDHYVRYFLEYFGYLDGIKQLCQYLMMTILIKIFHETVQQSNIDFKLLQSTTKVQNFVEIVPLGGFLGDVFVLFIELLYVFEVAFELFVVDAFVLMLDGVVMFEEGLYDVVFGLYFLVDVLGDGVLEGSEFHVIVNECGGCECQKMLVQKLLGRDGVVEQWIQILIHDDLLFPVLHRLLLIIIHLIIMMPSSYQLIITPPHPTITQNKDIHHHQKTQMNTYSLPALSQPLLEQLAVGSVLSCSQLCFLSFIVVILLLRQVRLQISALIFFPKAMFFSSIWEDDLTSPVSLAVLPFSLKSPAVKPIINAKALFFVLIIHAHIFPAIFPMISSLSMHHIVLPFALIFLTIYLNIHPSSLNLSVKPIALILRAVYPGISSFAVLEATQKLSLINVALFSNLLSISRWLIVQPVSVIDISTLFHVFSLTFCFGIGPISLVKIAARMSKFSMSIRRVIRPFTYINSSIWPSLSPKSLLFLTDHLSMVDYLVGIPDDHFIIIQILQVFWLHLQ